MKQRDEVLGVKIVGGLLEAATPWAGVSLLVELFRRSGVDEMANKVLLAKGLPSLPFLSHFLKIPEKSTD
jgi:hypothetical protein